MSTDHNKALLCDLNFRTALLESCDWDENQSNSLLLYLAQALNDNNQLPETILNIIKLDYGECAYLLIKKMFVDVYIENGFYSKIGSDDEH
tara:strand:- start:289 stop:561 length:273 start_codon:yes stop_codon:yes gene_type:complete